MIKAQRVVFPAPHHATWESFDLPENPGPYEVLVKTSWSAVSAGTETAIYAGTHIGFRTPGATYPRFPYYPGYAAVGRVLAMGSAVAGVSAGQEICLPGRHSTHTVWDTRNSPWAVLPAGLAADVAALARLAMISLNGIRLARIGLGDSVAVLGAGLIGLFAAQLARLAGGRPVVIVDLLESRLETARRCGIPATLNASVTDALRAGRAMTGGRGFDVVVEATGAPPAVAQALALAGEFSRVVLLGSPRGTVEIDPYTTIHRPGVTIVGAHELTTPRAETIHDRWTPQRNFQLVLDLLVWGELAGAPMISHRLPAAAAPGIYEALVQRPNDYHGVVFDWSNFA